MFLRHVLQINDCNRMRSRPEKRPRIQNQCAAGLAGRGDVRVAVADEVVLLRSDRFLEPSTVVAVQERDRAAAELQFAEAAVVVLARSGDRSFQCRCVVIDIAKDEMRRPCGEHGNDVRTADVATVNDRSDVKLGQFARSGFGVGKLAVGIADDSEEHGNDGESMFVREQSLHATTRRPLWAARPLGGTAR